MEAATNNDLAFVLVVRVSLGSLQVFNGGFEFVVLKVQAAKLEAVGSGVWLALNPVLKALNEHCDFLLADFVLR